MTNLIKKVNDLSGFGPVQQKLFSLFDTIGMVYETWQHPAIFTVEEGETLKLHDHIPGQGGKSLLLKSKNDDLWLIVACENTKVDLKYTAEVLGAKRFSFAKPEIMLDVMGVTPGSATPFALMNDKDKKINLAIDQKFTSFDQCVFHPLENKWSTVIAVKDLFTFVGHLGYQPKVMMLAPDSQD